MDKGEDPRETALRELSEEAGVVILSEKLHYLSTVHSYKACTKETHLFFADITGAGFIRPVGDGSEIEEEAFVRWHSLDDLLAAKDSLLLASYALAIKHLIL
jgi:8-oxo-dGTP pyrophosphatase MutT (NUDIX family)